MTIVIRQKRIVREDLQANPDVLYAFGDNEARTGMGGQAGEMRHQPNAVGVVTKRSPSRYPSAYFGDGDFDHVKPMIDAAFARLRAAPVVVIPLDGLGTGLAELPQRAPKIHRYILDRIAELEGESTETRQ